ncbi:hypothetical protein [Flavobacterium taihuense]|uniref:Uncharacterized protein n=1 Tax=Flavobacterium taihuense TaxID=2857508 RepID=A0ABS6XY01_9FLAO|nr:hypothetical protein [Flavobacterium taihuense]MBW4361553.1 hypothetical protein [Flavobacterium taihuense]
MKTIKLFLIALLLFAASSTQAQVSVNVNIGTPNVNVRVGTPPVWGPVGYDEVEYYYLPDIQVYYDIRLAEYIYFGNGQWIRSRYLPSHCRNYDLYHGYKVVLNDYHGHAPYTYFNTHKVKYYKGYKGKPQKNRGEYKVRYEDHDNHDNDHHDNGHHDNHGGKGNNGNGKGGKH